MHACVYSRDYWYLVSTERWWCWWWWWWVRVTGYQPTGVGPTPLPRPALLCGTQRNSANDDIQNRGPPPPLMERCVRQDALTRRATANVFSVFCRRGQITWRLTPQAMAQCINDGRWRYIYTLYYTHGNFSDTLVSVWFDRFCGQIGPSGTKKKKKEKNSTLVGREVNDTPFFATRAIRLTWSRLINARVRVDGSPHLFSSIQGVKYPKTLFA